jgi:hypothetical protein
MRVDDLERDGRAVFSSARWAGSPVLESAWLFALTPKAVQRVLELFTAQINNTTPAKPT